jgi:hypothetical protein
MTIPEVRFEKTLEDRLACIFYAMQLLSEKESVRRQGFILIIQYDQFCCAPSIVLDSFDDLIQAMPVRIADLHIITGNPANVDESHFFEQIVPKAFKLLLSFKDITNPMLLDNHQHVHMESSPCLVLQKLIACGLRREYLPFNVGGGWTLAKHGAWFRFLLQKEADLMGSKVFKGSSFCFPDASCTTGVSLSSAKKKRATEAWLSRQKRDRQRCREKSTKIRIEYLKTKNQCARQLSLRLEKYLQDAKKIISRLETSSDRPLPKPSTTVTTPVSFLPSMDNHPVRPLFMSSQSVPANYFVTTASHPMLQDSLLDRIGYRPFVLTRPLHLYDGVVVQQPILPPANPFPSPGVLILDRHLPIISVHNTQTATQNESGTPFNLFLR